MEPVLSPKTQIKKQKINETLKIPDFQGPPWVSMGLRCGAGGRGEARRSPGVTYGAERGGSIAGTIWAIAIAT